MSYHYLHQRLSALKRTLLIANKPPQNPFSQYLKINKQTNKKCMENYHYLKAINANYLYKVKAIAIKTPTALTVTFDKLIL